MRWNLPATVAAGWGSMIDLAHPSGVGLTSRHPRCPLRAELGDPEICAGQVPALIDLGGGHLCACHFRTPATSDETQELR